MATREQLLVGAGAGASPPVFCCSLRTPLAGRFWLPLQRREQPASLETLIVRFDDIAGLPFLDFQLSFFPNLLHIPEADNPLILQTFVEVYDRVDAQHFGELAQLIARINYFLPLGAFSLLLDPGLLFFKCTCLIDVQSDPSLTQQLFDIQVGMNLHSCNPFIPLLERLYVGELAIESAMAAVDAIASGG